MAELENACCSPEAQATCCEPADKADCCGTEPGQTPVAGFSACPPNCLRIADSSLSP
jgi:hypothetical protein